MLIKMPPPQITAQPADQTVNEGATATFRVTACGSVLTYKWQRMENGGSAWTDISGATASSYTTAATTMTDSGASLVCVVTNPVGSDTSSAAVLHVSKKQITSEKRNCGCGSGTGLALLPPIWFKVMSNRKRKKKQPK